MYRDGKMLENKAILFVCFLYCINNVRSDQIINNTPKDVEFHTYDNDTDHDVTTIYKIEDEIIPRLNHHTSYHYSGFMENNFLNEFNGKFSIDINLRTNAVGLPINKKNNCSNNILDIFDDNMLQNNISVKYVSYDTRYWIAQSYSDTTANEDLIDNLQIQCSYAVYVFSAIPYLQYYYGYSHTCYSGLRERDIYSFSWTPINEPITCLSFTYKITSLNMKYKLIIYDKYFDTQIISTELENGEGIKTMRLNNVFLRKGREYVLSLKFYNDMYICLDRDVDMKFTLMYISQCSTIDQDTTQTVSSQQINGLKHPYAFNVVGKTLQSYNQMTGGCLNGGFNSSKTSKCICPPGFKGQYCETGCGPNSFGADCMGSCSINDRMCRGMLMCTTYGCTCPVGLTGPWCDIDCQSGKYGADCKQNCSSNCYNNMCNQYTGICSQGCTPGYMMPHCREKYPYLINPPELLSSQFETLQIKLNLNLTNLKGGDPNIKLKYYQLFYKILGEKSYNTSELYLILNDTEITNTLSDLEPGTTYEIGALLITDDGNFNDQDIIYGQYITLCLNPRISDYNVKLISGVKSFNITWDDIQPSRFECHVTEYILTLMSDKLEKQKIISTLNNGHYLNDLLPSIEYKIKLTANTSNGLLESSPIYLAIPLMKENDAEITNVSTVITNGRIKVFWELMNPYKHYGASLNGPVTFTVKYKLARVFSCSFREIENEWTSLQIVNRTNYEILNAVPNSQYAIKVIVGDDDEMYNFNQENIIYALTPTSSPETKPILDIDHPMFITNNSVYVKWKVDPNECSKLNGFFSKFYFKLKDIKENSLRTDETKQNNIHIDNLKSNTLYELKIFIKTSFGYNTENYLAIDFKTKNRNLVPVDDLMVYKKSLKNRMVGLRWSYLENTTINGFLVSFDENSFTNTSNSFIIPPEKCLAWPEYYCHTFQNMTFNKTYTFKIKPTSVDYPDGGKVSSITFSAIDGLPDSPTNIKTTKIENTTINLQWDIPWTFNGALKTFNINVEEISSVDINSCCASITPIEIPISEELPTYNYTLEDLRPGSTYSIGIIAVSKSLWYSSPARISATTLD